MITPIERLSAVMPTEVSKPASSTDGLFSSVFQSAIQNVRETDAEKTEAEYLLATGQLDNPAALMIALSKNQTAVDLLVQLRNKAVEAYSELTRINL